MNPQAVMLDGEHQFCSRCEGKRDVDSSIISGMSAWIEASAVNSIFWVEQKL